MFHFLLPLKASRVNRSRWQDSRSFDDQSDCVQQDFHLFSSFFLALMTRVASPLFHIFFSLLVFLCWNTTTKLSRDETKERPRNWDTRTNSIKQCYTTHYLHHRLDWWWFFRLLRHDNTFFDIRFNSRRLLHIFPLLSTTTTLAFFPPRRQGIF